jgi:cell division protease FtsH
MRFGHPQGEVFLGRDFTSTPDYSDEVAAMIDAEVRLLIDAAHDAARQVLVDNREILDRLARELVVHETLEAERVQELFAEVQMWEAAAEGGRATARPEPTSPPPSRNNAAAATRSDTSRRPGGPA